MSKSELRRKCVVNPLDMADRLHDLEQENEKLKADVAMLRELLSVSRCPNAQCDNHGTVAYGEDIEQCQFCFERSAALSETASSDSPESDLDQAQRIR